MSPQKEQFIAWLNDAYSTELALMPVLKNHAKDAEEYPEIRDRDLQHLEETQRQADRLEEMIVNLGGKVSTAKSLLGSMIGAGQSISTEFFQDEITKNFLADYAAEHFEIASYKALIATAEQIGEHQCIPVLREILREEEAMAEWLEDHLPLAVRIGLEKTTSENYSRRRRSSRVYGKIKQNQALSTVVLGGTIGMVALYFMRNNQDKHQRRIEKVKTVPHRNVEGVAGRHISTATDESGSSTAEIPTSNNLTKTARGNS